MACQDRKAAALPTASAAGAGRRPAYPCAGLSARTRAPSQAPLGWGRVPPCTGPRQAGLPKQTFKTALIALLLLLASLPSKGMDKEAGRSARTPAPEVALLLPAQAQSGAPLRSRGAKRGHPLLYLSAAASHTPVCSSEAALSPPNPLSPCSCGKGTACHGERGVQGAQAQDGWLRKGQGREGRAPHTPSGLA